MKCKPRISFDVEILDATLKKQFDYCTTILESFNKENIKLKARSRSYRWKTNLLLLK